LSRASTDPLADMEQARVHALERVARLLNKQKPSEVLWF
jgi:hypothetical protein